MRASLLKLVCSRAFCKALILVVVFLSFPCSLDAQHVNLITNSTLEKGTEGWAANGPGCKLAEEGFNSKRSLLIEKSGKYSLWLMRVSGVMPRTDYIVSCRYKQDGNGSMQIVTLGHDLYLPAAKGGWQEYRKVIHSGDNGGTCTFQLLNEKRPSSVWFDDVQLLGPKLTPGQLRHKVTFKTFKKLSLAKGCYRFSVPPGSEQDGWGRERADDGDDLIDGDKMSSYYSANLVGWKKGPVEITFDLGRKITIAKAIVWYGFRLKKLTVAMSPDGKTYTRIADFPDLTKAYPESRSVTAFGNGKEAQFVKLAIDGTGKDEIQISEVEIYEGTIGQAHGEAVNLVQNPGVEIDADKDGIPDGWHHSDKKYLPKTKEGAHFMDIRKEKATYTWKDGGHTGRKCIAIDVASKDEWGEWETTVHDIKPNTDYFFSFWFKQSVSFTAQALIFGNDLYCRGGSVIPQWQRFTKTVNSGSFSGDCHIGFMDEGRVGRKMYIDDVVLREGPEFGPNEARMQFLTYDKSAISPDLTSPLPFSLSYRFLECRPKRLEVVLELPADVEVVGVHLDSVRPGQARPEKELFQKDGQNYIRYRLFYPVTRSEFHTEHKPYSVGWKPIWYYLRTKLKEGTRRAYYYLGYNGSYQSPKVLPLEVVRVRKTAAPKRLITNTVIPPRALYTWPNLLDEIAQLGFNSYVFYGSTADAERVKKIQAQAGRLKLLPSVANQHLGDSFKSDPDSQALNVDGQKFSGEIRPCFSKKGKAWRANIQKAKDNIDKGFYFLMYDDEYNGPEASACYCDDCIEKFKKFLKEYDPALKFSNPRAFEKSKKQHPELHGAWVNFAKWNYAQAAIDCRREAEKYLGSKGIPPSQLKFYNDGYYIGGNVQKVPDSELVLRAFAAAFDYYGEQFYINCYGHFRGDPGLVGERAVQINQLYGKFVKQFPCMGTGLAYMDPVHDLQPHKLMKYQLMEIFAAGVHGFHLFPWRDVDLLDLKFAAEAIHMILPVEDIVIDGKLIDSEAISVSEGRTHGVSLKEESVIIVSDYTVIRDGPKAVTFRYAGLNRSLNVIDLWTKKKIGELSPERKDLELHLADECARLLYVGPKTGLAPR